MQPAFSSAYGKTFDEAYGYDVSPYAVLDENLDAITDLYFSGFYYTAF